MIKRNGLWLPHTPGIIHRSRWMDARGPIPLHVGLKGRLIVELIHAATGFVKQRLEFDNLITDAGLNGIGNVGTIEALTTWAGCGTGTNAPANGDTALQTEITPAASNRTNTPGAGVTTNSYTAGPPDFWEAQIVREFATTQANGNLTEIGFFTASSGGTMFMRQLFKDGSGTPIVISKTSADVLRVTYKLRMNPPQGDSSSTVVISGTTYTWTQRALGVDQARSWGFTPSGGVLSKLGAWDTGTANSVGFDSNVLAARTATTMGGTSLGNCSSWTPAAYTAGNFFRDVTAVAGLGTWNVAGGVGGTWVLFGPGALSGAFQTVWSPKFNKDNTKVLTLVWRISWGRFP